MKSLLSIILGIVCIALIVALFMTKQGDNTQIGADAAAIVDLSNQLSSAQSQLAANSGTITTFSNSLNECQSGSLTISNQLATSQAAVTRDGEQITKLQTQLAALTTDNQGLSQQIALLTNQVTTLTQHSATVQTNLDAANQALARENTDYVNLENRFRMNVAERVVMQRKFYNISELQEQLARLKENPYSQITADMIYAGLDVQVSSNGTFHVISRD